MVLGKLPVPGRPTILITVGQGPIRRCTIPLPLLIYLIKILTFPRKKIRQILLVKEIRLTKAIQQLELKSKRFFAV